MKNSNQLLSDDFIKIAYDSYGGDIKEWPESLKSRAEQMAQRNGTRDQLNKIFIDFIADGKLLPLYECKVTEVLNSVYATLEESLQDDIDAWVEANITPRLQGYK